MSEKYSFMGRACLRFLNLPLPFSLLQLVWDAAEKPDRRVISPNISRKPFGSAREKPRDREILDPSALLLPARNDNLFHAKVYLRAPIFRYPYSPSSGPKSGSRPLSYSPNSPIEFPGFFGLAAVSNGPKVQRLNRVGEPTSP